MKEGLIVKSLMGHDAGRKYVVISVINENFVLLCDGKYRPLDKPKMKRIKHVEPIAEADVSDLTDSKLRKLCK